MNSHGIRLQQISIDCEECSEKDQRIAELEATRVPDEVLEASISALKAINMTGNAYLAEAILAKRKEQVGR